MRLPGPNEAYILYDDARARGAAAARLYRDPVATIVAHSQAEVQPALDRIADARDAGLHAAGYISYEAGLALEPRLAPIAARSELAGQAGAMPLLWFGLFEGCRRIAPDDVAQMLPPPVAAAAPPRPLVTEAEYRTAFAHVQELIRAGDIYQVNLTFPCEMPIVGDPLAFYAAVRARARAGYGGILSTGSHQILSFSPELFFTLVRGQLTTRPMKGTALRAGDVESDAAAIRQLATDPKQRAENLMIVDLLRNDLSRVSQAGSVTVPDLFKVETYPTVHQLVSTVRGRILPGLGAVDVMRVLFPCGSITGAPKVRAMEIIAGVEASPRGVYTGALGWIDPDGDAAFNVAIRTLAMGSGGPARLGLGSGIVADSRVEDEWAECLAKGKFLVTA